MDQKEELPDEIIDYAPKEWICPNCRSSVISVYAPGFPCKKCGNSDWVLRQPKGGNNNNNNDPDDGLDMRKFYKNKAQLLAIAKVSKIAWSKSGGNLRVSVEFGDIHARLLAWIAKLEDANKLPGGGRVHVENLDPENPEHRVIQQNIVLAQIGIMDLIVECMEDEAKGDYFSALGGAGVIDYFLGYLEVTQCNQHAAAQLRKRANKISCDLKS